MSATVLPFAAAKPVWRTPGVLELFGDEADQRRAECEPAPANDDRADAKPPAKRKAGPGAHAKIAVSIPDRLFTDRPFRALRVMERYLLIELIARKRRIDQLAREHGKETDDVVGCSVREAADLCRVTKSHAARAMARLEETGFIVPARRGVMGTKRRRGTATGWRLTFLPFQGGPPTLDYVKRFDRAARQKIAESVRGQSFFTPGMEQ